MSQLFASAGVKKGCVRYNLKVHVVGRARAIGFAKNIKYVCRTLNSNTVQPPEEKTY